MLNVVTNQGSFMRTLEARIDIRRDFWIDSHLCGDLVRIPLERGCGPEASVSAPTPIFEDVAVDGHIDLDLLHITRRIKLEMPQDDISRVGVRRAKMLNRA